MYDVEGFSHDEIATALVQLAEISRDEGDLTAARQSAEEAFSIRNAIGAALETTDVRVQL